MQNKPTWLQTIIQTIGLSELVAILLGVPAMITGVITIWSKLAQNEQTIVIICIAIILLSIGIFVYGKIRKTLYRLPIILQNMHSELMNTAINISTGELDDNLIKDFMYLSGIQQDELLSALSNKGISEMIASIPDLVKTAENKIDNIKNDEVKATRTFYYLYEATGLMQALKENKRYQNNHKNMSKMMSKMPTKAIIESVLAYCNTSWKIGVFTPFNLIGYQSEEYLPLEHKIDNTMLIEKADERMNILLAKVRESIWEYYKKGG